MREKTKVFAYIRVSTETQAERGYGLEDQQREIERYIVDHQFVLVAPPFVDKGQSGAIVDWTADELESALERRTALLDMLERLDEVSMIVVLNTSRLWREDGPRFYIQRALRRKGVDILSIEQPSYSLYSNIPSNRFVNAILEAVDMLERDSIRVKLARGRAVKASHGDKPAGIQPYGYQYGPDRKATVFCEQEAKVVQQIFKLASMGFSLQRIADELNTQGLTTRRGKQFSKAGLHMIITNDFYTGVLTYQGRKYQGNHPELISQAEFDGVQAGLGGRRKGNKKRNA